MTEQERYERMRQAAGSGVTLTADADKLLRWLAGWDEWTVKAACDLITGMRAGADG